MHLNRLGKTDHLAGKPFDPSNVRCLRAILLRLALARLVLSRIDAPSKHPASVCRMVSVAIPIFLFVTYRLPPSRYTVPVRINTRSSPIGSLCHIERSHLGLSDKLRAKAYLVCITHSI